jgi:hypothetical protein
MIECGDKIFASLSTTAYGREIWAMTVPSPGTLPLTLLEFNGRIQNNDGLLNWKTENEVNTLSFIVERSTNGRNFSAIGTKLSNNAPGINNYAFTDPGVTSLGTQMVYYRLKQKDIDDRFTYSRIVALPLDKSKTVVMLYPNPASNELNLTVNMLRSDKVVCQVIDAAGKLVRQETKQLSSGSSSWSIDISRLAPGAYYFNLQGSVVNQQLSFIKQ